PSTTEDPMGTCTNTRCRGTEQGTSGYHAHVLRAAGDHHILGPRHDGPEQHSFKSLNAAVAHCAAKWMACCPEPHWRSTVVPGTVMGRTEESTTPRPRFPDCAPTWPTQPKMTSSTAAGSILLRWTRAFTTAAPRSAGWVFLSLPFFF